MSRGERAEEGEGPVSLGLQPSRPRLVRHTVRFDLANVALAALVVVLVIRAFSFVELVRSVILLLILAVLLAAAIDPIVTRFRRGGVSRGTSVLGIYLIVVSLLAAFVITAAQTIANQVTLFVERLPTLTDRLREVALGLPPGPLQTAATSFVEALRPDELTELITTSLTTGTLSQVLLVTLTVVEALFGIVTVFVIAYFWLAERTVIRRLVLRTFSVQRRPKVLLIWNDVEAKLGAWVRGQLLLMLIIGVAQGAGYLALGLPFALLLAVFAALAEAIPLIGPYLGAAPAVIVALTISPQTALILIGYTAVLHLVESNVLVPRIMEQAVGLTPLTVVLALLAGATLAGIPGALLAIPIAAAVQVAIVDLLQSDDRLDNGGEPSVGLAKPDR